MNKLDFYYRGFKDYRKQTQDATACEKERKNLKKSGLEFDLFETIKYLCTIDEDWVSEIEKGLVFIEKAVKEERQFIRTEGETVPIEKAKKVSKHTVEHLARHSNLITHVPENPEDDLIPDELYIVERFSDYAVYENRFLYMLLCYLRDFIGLRLERVETLRMTYKCNFSLKKDYESKKHNYNYSTIYNEVRYDNPYPIIDSRSDGILQRAKDCQQIVMMLLGTDLMVEVAKAPMVKPPIIKTNVLKMNNNFKNAVALYDYIVSYKGEGYTSEEVLTNYAPFADNIADEFAEVGCMTSFLTYKYGNELTDMLEINFQEEEERLKELEIKKLQEQIKRLKKRVVESGMSMEEYMLSLEKYNRHLEACADELIVCKNEIIELNRKIDDLNNEILELNRKIEGLKLEIDEKNAEIAYLNQKYIDDMLALKKAHAQEILVINKKHDEYVVSMLEKFEVEKQELNDLCDKKIIEAEKRIAMEYEDKMSIFQNNLTRVNNELLALKAKYNNEVKAYDEKVTSLANELVSTKSDRDKLVKEYERKIIKIRNQYDCEINNHVEKYNIVSAELKAIQVINGILVPTDDLASREEFKQLENEFNAFKKFFNQQWALTKKAIRKEMFSSMNLKDKDKK